MAASNFMIKVLTPQGEVLIDFASAAYFPTMEGQIGILPQHIRYVGVVDAGILEYTSHPKKETLRAAVLGGLCYFDDNCLTLLTEEAAIYNEMPDEVMKKEKERLQKFISDGPYDDSFVITAQKKVAYLNALKEMPVLHNDE